MAMRKHDKILLAERLRSLPQENLIKEKNELKLRVAEAKQLVDDMPFYSSYRSLDRAMERVYELNQAVSIYTDEQNRRQRVGCIA